jgi:hypothetical protein
LQINLRNYFPGLALNHNLLISASQVARIIGVKHRHLAVFIFMCSCSITKISEHTHTPVSSFYKILMIESCVVEWRWKGIGLSPGRAKT